MDAQGWAIIIGAIFLGLTQLLNLILNWINGRAAVAGVKRANLQTTRAAFQVQAVKKTLVETTKEVGEKLADIAVVGVATHMLVNSAMGALKRAYAAKCRAMANLTGSPPDIAEAEAAEEDLRQYEERQNAVDFKDKSDPKPVS